MCPSPRNLITSPVGRGSVVAPANRFERITQVPDLVDLEHELLSESEPRKVPTEFYDDRAQSILRENASPDLPFRFSLNPYRGCEHGCAYCYARPGHETLGWNAGLDFETRILVKRDAAELLRRDLNRPVWQGEPITISGVTDCYQPAERRFRLTRKCLEVLWEARQPFSIVTKNALVLRDLDLLQEAARHSLVHVHLSITTLDETLARKLEPRTSSIAARLGAISRLAAVGVPVGSFMAPIIPGLNDHEIPQVLQACHSAGAQSAAWQLLRLPWTVEPVFREWLARELPERQLLVESRIRECRGGKWNDAEFGKRMRGSGAYAQQIGRVFQVFAEKLGLKTPLPPLDRSQFRRPACGVKAAARQQIFHFDEASP